MAGDLIAQSCLTLSEKLRLIVLANLPAVCKAAGKQKTGCKLPVIGNMLLQKVTWLCQMCGQLEKPYFSYKGPGSPFQKALKLGLSATEVLK